MKPAGKVFDRTWRCSCKIKRINRRLATPMIESHYLGRWPKMTMLTLGLYRGSKLLGVITYSAVHRSIQEQFGVGTWELSRLWIKDSVPTNGESFFISGSVKYIKKQHPEIKTLISFADPKYGHHGVVYRASNWKEQQHSSKNLFVMSLG